MLQCNTQTCTLFFVVCDELYDFPIEATKPLCIPQFASLAYSLDQVDPALLQQTLYRLKSRNIQIILVELCCFGPVAPKMFSIASNFSTYGTC